MGQPPLGREPAVDSGVPPRNLTFPERLVSPLFFHARGFGPTLLLVLFVTPAPTHSQTPPPQQQIDAAIQASPVEQRAGATVLGYDETGSLVTLREGDNELICLADPPGDARFSVACYHRSLGAYMARGRELSAAGITDGMERNRLRWKEAEEGSLTMPKDPATLYVLSGSGVEEGSGAVLDPYLRFVVYVPWATLESTGLPAQPMGPGSPWLMFPGTAGAHIMISPPPKEGG